MAFHTTARNALTVTKKSVALLLSLSFALIACQTTQSDEAKSKTEDILNSQKAIVHNALDNGDTKLAYQTLRQLVHKFPEDASIQNLMGLTQLAMKNSAKAVKHFMTAYNIDKSAGSALNLSSAYIDVGDYDKAIALINAVLSSEKSKNYQYKERFFHNLGYAHLKLKRSTKAEALFKKALEENPQFYPSHLELARLQKTLGRPALAVRSYRNAMDYCHVCLDPVSELTTLFVKTGKIREARDILIKFSKIQGVSDADRKKAGSLLNIVTATGLPKVRSM